MDVDAYKQHLLRKQTRQINRLQHTDAAALKALRERRGKSAEEVARALQISPADYLAFEAELRSIPYPLFLRAVEACLS